MNSEQRYCGRCGRMWAVDMSENSPCCKDVAWPTGADPVEPMLLALGTPML